MGWAIPISKIEAIVRQAVRDEVRAAVRDEVGEILKRDACGPLSLDDAAQALGVSRRTVRRLIERKKLRPLRVGGRVLIPRSQVEGILRNGTK